MRGAAHQSARKTTPRPRGFTLIELLVLVAIVCILALLLLAVFSRIKEPVKARCLGNVEQISRALLMYAEDNSDRLPPRRDWPDLLLPYLGDPRVLTCPDDAEAWPGYAYHPPVAGEKLGSFKRLEETVLVYDGKEGKLAERHFGWAYYAFADGHAKPLRDPPPGYFAEGGLAPRSRCSPTVGQ